MVLWRIVWGVAIGCAACGAGSTGSDPVDAAASPTALPSMDAQPRDIGSVPDSALAADGPGPDHPVASATWSSVYGQLLVNANYPSNCTGAACHDPGVEKGIDLSTREKGWSSIMPRVVPGMPEASDLISVLQSGYMPLGRPQMSASNIAQIGAWIAAGAQDD